MQQETMYYHNIKKTKQTVNWKCQQVLVTILCDAAAFPLP